MESFTKSVFFSIAEGKLPNPEPVLVMEDSVDSVDTSNCCFRSAGEKMSRDVDFEPRLDEVLVKFSETHQAGSDELICQNYISWLISI